MKKVDTDLAPLLVMFDGHVHNGSVLQVGGVHDQSGRCYRSTVGQFLNIYNERAHFYRGLMSLWQQLYVITAALCCV